MKQLSLLLGAGFSKNKGYPIGNELNELLVNLNPTDIGISSDGTVFKNGNEEFITSGQDILKHFVTRFIELFNRLNHGDFDYEEFFDFYKEIERGERTSSDFDELCRKFREEKRDDTDNIILISHTNQIMNQLVSMFLIDGDGNKFYDPIHHCKPIYPGYSGFLNCLEHWGDTSTVHVHTLNHDLFFEVFKSSDWIQGELTDGFEENGSPYFGTCRENYRVRLSRFTNKYDKKFRLYKLHGSVDQYPFHIRGTGIESYIKIKKGVDKNELLKEVEVNGEYKYIDDWINYHPDFLTGTTSKIIRYSEPWYYEKLFTHFENNLKNSEQLIIIGYGCRDTGVNDFIEKHFDYINKPIFMVEPKPSEKSIEFKNRFNALLIPKTPNDLALDDFAK